ncbi:adenosylcobinamide-GDP ribazoletransferase [Anaeromicrobium sediminis]|uniref:Adenosylcobinamide-GDP ribazoletransferase n=1 Tax=Anaeromicrobium sediminis TaxID=1478221 RepID=A0A267MMJ9_9FIRM|nr:adenosylcobinamide-GDP ribazoletransferase [Anaeromicrobium sediminis]PAB60766.1 adenosylcobinamide-GDP ribazoletransferase [Anaeromicrobium sediminis]
MKKLILMIQFLTRIPININLDVDESDFLDGIMYFPLVGIIIGLFVSGSYYLGYSLGGSFLGAVFTVVGGVFITGGLHLDGLSDTFDGIYSNRDKERILEIMKDSRLGANGALAMLILIILKISLIKTLGEKLSGNEIYYYLILMPVFARMCQVFGARFSVYARNNGMGGFFIGKTTNKHLIGALITCVLISLIKIEIVWIFLVAYVFSIWYINHISSKIGGMTGDTLGALCELGEVFYTFVILVYVVLS